VSIPAGHEETGGGVLLLEMLEHLDFDPECTCEFRRGCNNTAQWLAINPCPCKYSQALCGAHKIRLEHFLDGIKAEGRMGTCAECADIFYPEAVRIEPIGGPQ
jgi:hypothetical protein